jgi:hypothetical protein
VCEVWRSGMEMKKIGKIAFSPHIKIDDEPWTL